jgi:tetratricopeptide (TPR) repeat protein
MITSQFTFPVRVFLTLGVVIVTLFSISAQTDTEIGDLKIIAKQNNISGYSASALLANHYWNHSIDSSLVYGKNAFNIAMGLTNDSLISSSAVLIALSYSYKDLLDSTIKYCYLAIDKSNKNVLIKARALDLLGITYRRTGVFDSSLSCSNKSLVLYKSAGDTVNYAKVLGNISSTLDETGSYSEALDYSLRAAKIFDELHDSVNLARRYGTIANIYLDMGNNQKGIEFLQRAKLLVRKGDNPNLYYNIVFNMATVYHDLGLYDSALNMYNQALTHYLRINDNEGVAIAHQNIGLTYSEKGDFGLAIKHLLEGYRRFSQLSTVRNIAYVLSDIGLVYSKKGVADSSVFFLNKALSMAKQYNLILEEQRIYYKFYQVYKSINEYKKALMYYEMYRNISDSISSEKIAEKIAELNSRFETDLKDQRIKQLILNREITEAKNRTLLISAGLFVIILVLLAAILYYRKHTQARLLTIKGKLLEKEKTELDKELSFKQKLLTSHALHMTQKNRILQNIRKAVNDVLPEVPDETKSKVKRLQMELNKSLRYDKDWELFSRYFSELNNDFFEKLKSINPDLTQYDLRLSALLRMKMNIKEASAVLNIEPDSVKTARYKLRKKLGLSPERDLVEFISGL